METWLLGVIIRSARLESFQCCSIFRARFNRTLKNANSFAVQIVEEFVLYLENWTTKYETANESINYNCKSKGNKNYNQIVRTSIIGQATKGAGRMPWHQEPMKDVISCDKPRGAANKLWSVDFWMEQSTWVHTQVSYTESIGVWGEPPELKHLSRARKRHQPRFR